MKPEEFKRLNIKALSKLAHNNPQVIADVYGFGFNAGIRWEQVRREEELNRTYKSKVTITN
jgi:hypothetical protein